MNCGHIQSQPAPLTLPWPDFRLGTPGPTLQPQGSRPSLTFNLLRCKLDLKGDPRDSKCLAQEAGPDLHLHAPRPQPRPQPLDCTRLSPWQHSSFCPHDLLPSPLAPPCLLIPPNLCELRAVGLRVPRP